MVYPFPATVASGAVGLNVPDKESTPVPDPKRATLDPEWA